MDTAIYKDMAARTGGEVYIGVVGPVRSGKSTFIKRFMEAVVLPGIENDFERERARDELPQSAGGKTVMTTEPKFIPDEGVMMTAGDAKMKVKLIDCVGYMVKDALGGEEDGHERMVHTPWHESPVPFEEAAEYGTHKVISDHATIGMLVTSDGTVGEIPRDSYISAEERIAAELTTLGKPFAVILNSAYPDSDSAHALAGRLEEKYNAPVALVSCLQLDAEDISGILSMLIEEFPAKEADIVFPQWTAALPESHGLRSALTASVKAAAGEIHRVRDVKGAFADRLSEKLTESVSAVGTYPDTPRVNPVKTDVAEGRVVLEVSLPEGLYYDVISEITGLSMKNESDLLSSLTELTSAKREFDKYKSALDEVNEKGYGIVLPDINSLKLEEPQIIKQSGGYGVRLKASAPSIHMIKTEIETEINPMIGTEAQYAEMKDYLQSQFSDPTAIWKSGMFGKSLYELLNDGLHSKLEHMPEDAREKLGETLSKIINEGSQGLICIIL